MSTHININLGNALNYNFYPYQLNLSCGDSQQISCDREEDLELSALLKPIACQKSSEASWTMPQEKFQKLCTILQNKALCGIANGRFDDAGVSRTPVSFNDGRKWVLTALHGKPAL